MTEPIEPAVTVARDVTETLPQDPIGRPQPPTEEALPIDWQDVLMAPAGASKPRNLMPREVRAVGQAVAEMERELEPPVLVSDRALLGLLASTMLMRYRAWRLTSQRGMMKCGEVRGIVAEWRALVRQEIELIGKLKWRRDLKRIPALQDYLEQRSSASSARKSAPASQNIRTKEIASPASTPEGRARVSQQLGAGVPAGGPEGGVAPATSALAGARGVDPASSGGPPLQPLEELEP